MPIVDDILREHPELWWQQDNAPGHASKFTKEVITRAGLRVIEWPPFSPDLSPIEALWDIMKDWIQARYPEVHSSYPRLRRVVDLAWEAISYDQIRDLVRSMQKRCKAVIAANGWHTKY